jgi:hypothetical protein
MTYGRPVDEEKATAVVARLRDCGTFAHVHPVGVYAYGVRVVLPFPDGREAIWDADGAAGLEAVLMRDGVLVGLVEEIPGSEDLDIDGVADVIARTDYDAPLAERPHAGLSGPPPGATPAPAHPRGGGLRRLLGRG